MKTNFALRLAALNLIFMLLSCDSAEPVGGDDGLFTFISCEEIAAEQNYTAWCGAIGSEISATVIDGSNLSCSLAVKYQNLDVPAYSVSIQLLNSVQSARLFIDDLSRTLYQKIANVSDLGDEAAYYQTDNADTSRALAVRAANAVVTVSFEIDFASTTSCIREIDELKVFTNQILLNLEV